MNLPLHIARRYLFAKKTHNTINIVSMVSVLGVAVAVAALVCTLSVYNGFRNLLEGIYSRFDPQIKIRVVDGKTFRTDNKTFDAIRHDKDVAVFCETLEENALVQYKDAQTGATVKGVSDNFAQLTPIDSILFAGHFALNENGINYATIGMGLAGILGTGLSFIDPITINTPKRLGSINLANPAASFNTTRILLSGTFGINQPEYDNNLILVPIAFARTLFDYTKEVTAVEIKLKDGVHPTTAKKSLQNMLGNTYTVQDIAEQKADFYRINQIEKWMTYLILSFILLIALFNVIGSLSMLILEKREDTGTLSKLGASPGAIRKIFLLEGRMIAFSGAILGIALGSVLCYVQQRFGLLKLGGGGNYIIDAYPVKLMLKDVLLVLLTVLIVSIPATWWPVAVFFKSKKDAPGKPTISQNKRSGVLLGCLTLCIQAIWAQIPHGGQPFQNGIEKSAHIQGMFKHAKSIDYFVEMPSFDVDSARATDDPSGFRVGGLSFAHKFFVNLTPENSGITFQANDSTRVWKIGIRSWGAYSLNVLFSRFSLPEGAKVFLYNADRSTILGSFTRENRPEGGEFSVSPVDGDELTIEYQEPSIGSFKGDLCLSEVNHDYRGLFRAGTRFNQTILPCIPDVSCNSAYDTIGRSVCLLIINGTTYCTGTLINNTANDGKPYLITASHCLNNDSEWGKRIVAFLNYDSPRCDKRIRGSEEFSVSGSTTRALSNEVDFALLELTETPPTDYRPYLAGWSLDSLTENASPYTGIHHPFGEVKKYCVSQEPITETDWSGNGIEAGNHWNVHRWDIGHTWIGSSGSPLFDQYNRFRGGLTGGDSGGESGCEDYIMGDFYYRINRAWDQFPDYSKQLKHWLDPLTPDSVKSPVTLNGLDPYAQNPAVRVSNLTPSDSMGRCFLDIPEWGSLFGQNSLGTSHFAEHFHTTDSCMIYGAYLVSTRGHNDSDLPVTIKIYKGGDTPGTVLGKKILNPNYLEYLSGTLKKTTKEYFSNRENYVRFDDPIAVGTDFYVGYEVSYPVTATIDTFYLYAAIRKESLNTACFKENNTWLPYSSHPLKPVQTSLWIEPVVAGDTITASNPYQETGDSTEYAQPILFYSVTEELLYVQLPKDWLGNTRVEVFHTTGQLLATTTITPPAGSIKLRRTPKQVVVVRLTNERNVCALKIRIGQD